MLRRNHFANKTLKSQPLTRNRTQKNRPRCRTHPRRRVSGLIKSSSLSIHTPATSLALKSPTTKVHKASFSTQIPHSTLAPAITNLVTSATSPLVILGIETSCDDTSIAVVSSERRILATASLNQLGLHQLHGGVVPTIAMRSHAITINQLVAKALLGAAVISTTCASPNELPLNCGLTPTFIRHPTPGRADDSDANSHSKSPELTTHGHIFKYPLNNYLECTTANELWLETELDKLDQFRQHLFLRARTSSPTPETAIHPSLTLDCDAIAFTLGPGLSGSLAVGVDTAKAMGTAFKVPIVPVNHIIAHTTVSQLTQSDTTYPYLGLVVSGGHTQLNYVKDEQTVTVIASTVDDAIGEAFDKIYRGMDMESFDFASIQALINHKQPEVLNQMRNLRSLWPQDIRDRIDVSGNELLMDCYDRIVQEDGHKHDAQERHLFPLAQLSADIENHQIGFINEIQSVPALEIKKVRLEPIGNVDDLYNSKQTPQAFFATFNEALNKLEEQDHQTLLSETRHTRTTPIITRTSEQSALPSTTSTQTLAPQQSLITPKSEREVLIAVSNQKSTPYGAQIELAARMHADVLNILQAYDFFIEFCTRTPTPLMVATEHARTKFFEMETNRAFGGMRKAGKLLPLQRFLPIVPLPLPLHVSNKNQSYASLSYSGFKGKIRQHIQSEIQFMNSIEKLAHDKVRSDEEGGFASSPHDWDADLAHYNDDTATNPYSRAPLKVLQDTPVYLRYLVNHSPSTAAVDPQGHSNSPQNPDQHTQDHPQYSKTVSTLYKLCISAQFQMTATEHLISKMTRAIQYLDRGLVGQKEVLVMTSPQGLDQLLIPATDPSFHIGHPSHTPDYTAWTAFTESVLLQQTQDFPQTVPIYNDIVIGGGVACNKFITENIKHHFKGFENVLRQVVAKRPTRPEVEETSPLDQPPELAPVPPPLAPFRVISVPPAHCADNGIMIAWSGLQKLRNHQARVADSTPLLSRPGTHLEYSHVMDPIALKHQQDVMDRHFVRLYGNTVITTSPDGQKSQPLPPTSRAEEFSTLYQRPKWPLHELFIPKPARETKR